MIRYRILCLLILICLLTSCKVGMDTPEATGVASPEAVALSLSTVDPDESLHLFTYDRTAPLDIQEERRWHEDSATWIDFTFASPKGGRVPARLVIPDGKGPFPGIVLQHGGPGILEEMVDFARAFTRYGAVSIMITSPYRRPGGWEITQYMGNTWPIFTDRDIEIKIQTINDLQRVIDILEERPEVDPKRLAYFGVSWGGSMGGLLAGIEDRLGAYVLVVGDGGLVEHTADPSEDGLNIHFSEGWATRMWPTEPLHFVGRAAPAALLFQNGLHDTYVPPHDALRFYTAASEPKTMIWYDAGHNLPWKFVNDAARWLQPYLGERLLFSAPNYRPSAVVWERIIIAVVALSVGILLWDTFRRGSLGWGERVIWLLGMVPLGPVGLIFYGLASRERPDPSAPALELSRWQQTLGVTILSTMSLTIGLFFGDKISEALSLADFRLMFLQLYLTILIGTWLFTFLTRRTYRAAILAQILLVNLFWVVVVILPTLLRQHFANIPIWPLYTLEALSGILVSSPLHAWMLNCGLEHWYPSAEPARPAKTVWLVAIGLLIFSYLAVLGSIMFVVQVYSGLSWKDVFLFIVGINF